MCIGEIDIYRDVYTVQCTCIFVYSAEICLGEGKNQALTEDFKREGRDIKCCVVSLATRPGGPNFAQFLVLFQ